MTQITREQAQEALRSLLTLEKGSYKWLENQAFLDAYIIRMDQDLRHNLIARDLAFKKCEQLEAQRQPVSDEKLRDAVSRIDDEFCSATEFNRELCENDWAIIANSLSEMETLRTKNAKLEERVKVLESATNRMKQVCRCPRADETCDSPGITLMQACIDEATLAGGKEGA